MLRDTGPDAIRLRAALRDLVAVSAIPAVWIGKEPSDVAGALADALVELLQLDFAFVRLSIPGGPEAVEVTRGSAWPRFSDWLDSHLATSGQLPQKEIVPDIGGSESCCGLVMPVGFNGDRGVVAAACGRSDFPTATDELLLSLAANHGATAFQSARAEEELRHARDGLEVKVAERTAELEELAGEQAALRRVATLVASGVPPQELFAVVAEEIGRVIDVPLVRVVRYESDDAATQCASFSADGTEFPFGTQSSLEGTSVLRLVRETSVAARIDDYSELDGEIAEIARDRGIRSSVGTPIVVAGRLWGAVVASSNEQLPDDTAVRLTDFTELLATAIASAESDEARARLVDEQAALRRVATLVARGVPPEDLFAAVAEEVGQLLPVSSASMGRFDPDGMVTTVAAWSTTGAVVFPVGRRWMPEGKNATTLVLEAGAPARIDDFADASGPVGVVAREAGYRSAVGSPIVVEGRLWGVMTAASTAEQPLPADTEARLASFTELVATAIANSESRAALGLLADEQAALRRVATLVARGASATEILAVVAEEVGRFVSIDGARIIRYESDGTATVISRWSEAAAIPPELEAGSRLTLDGESVAALVLRTGRPARMDSYEKARGSVGELMRRYGFRSSAGAPIVVGGKLWGVMAAVSSQAEPLSVGLESRIAEFTELVATAIANAESRAELTASRARIVAASDEARRRIERDLHDGTQQRLVSLGLAVRAAESIVPPGSGDLRAELSRIAMGLADSVEDLQEISRGIHPAILSKGGLGPALETLAHRSTIPVEFDLTTDTRLAEPIEVAAYFVVSEALANAVKHAQASQIEVSLATRNGSLLLSIRDDGVGGADSTRGSGLVGLTDRVEALGGTIDIESPPGGGTSLVVTLPLVEPMRG